MSNYIFAHHDNGRVEPVRKVPGNAQEEIKPGYYRLCVDEGGPHLHAEEPFKLPKEIYGDVDVQIDRYFRSFELNDKNLGISLVGMKGSGKTLQAKMICKKGFELSYPVITISEYIPASIVGAFLKTVEQNVIIMVDEFDKLYSSNNENGGDDNSLQDGFPSILDGTNSIGKKMFILTLNQKGKLGEFLQGRPSRVRYNVAFDLLPNNVLRDYVIKNLLNATEHDVASFCLLKVLLNTSLRGGTLYDSDELNFDTMKELVHEMKQFKETLRDAWCMMKFGSHHPSGVQTNRLDLRVHAHDIETGVKVPFASYVQKEEGDEVGEQKEVFHCPALLIVNQLSYHTTDGVFVEVTPFSKLTRASDLVYNPSIGNSIFDSRDLLAYDRDYFPIYMRNGIIFATTVSHRDPEVTASDYLLDIENIRNGIKSKENEATSSQPSEDHGLPSWISRMPAHMLPQSLRTLQVFPSGYAGGASGAQAPMPAPYPEIKSVQMRDSSTSSGKGYGNS